MTFVHSDGRNWELHANPCKVATVETQHCAEVLLQTRLFDIVIASVLSQMNSGRKYAVLGINTLQHLVMQVLECLTSSGDSPTRPSSWSDGAAQMDELAKVCRSLTCRFSILATETSRAWTLR